MHVPRQLNIVHTNRLLAALPRSEFERLAPHLKQTDLPKYKILYDAGEVVRHAYFVQSGMISLLSVTDEGEGIEVAVIGYEGMVGIPGVMHNKRAPLQTMVQISGKALRIEAIALRREFMAREALRDLLLGYTHSLVTQMAQTVACNHYHTVEKRLCRWLLMTRDCVHEDTFLLTHELIADMLGTTRSGVTSAAIALQDAGLIRYRRGRISILDNKGLEGATCACYRAIKKDSESYLAA